MMRRWDMRACAAVASLMMLLLFALPRASEAHPYGGNAGGAHYAENSSLSTSDIVRNADGLYVQENVETMDVPRANGTPGTAVTCTDVRGANARPMQILAQNPARLQGVEFQAIGVAAGRFSNGTGGTNCTGTTNGNINKRVYRDGIYCDLNCEYRSSMPGPNVSAGGPYAFQMQRRFNGTNDFYWDLYFENDYRLTITTLQFESGAIGIGAESTTEGAPDNGQAGHQNLNMGFNNARQLHMHRFGTASASAPGLSNYVRIPWTRAENPHAAVCAVNGSFESGQVVLRGVGRC